MAHSSHDLNLVNQRLFSFILAICSFFRKGFHSIFFTILIFNHQIYRSEVTFSNFFNGFE